MEITTTPEAQMSANTYLTEIVDFGGELVTRGAMIVELNRIAAARTKDPAQQQRLVNMYLIGSSR